MIIDSISNASKYFSGHPLFEKAFSFIAATDLASAADGKLEIAEGLKAIFSNTFFQLTDGQFAIFFPEDVHAPMIGEGTIKKLVIKVKI